VGYILINYSEIRENSQCATKREDCGVLLYSQQTASELWKHRYLFNRETDFGTYRSAILNFKEI
jgi:hypothetical protein